MSSIDLFRVVLEVVSDSAAVLFGLEAAFGTSCRSPGPDLGRSTKGMAAYWRSQRIVCDLLSHPAIPVFSAEIAAAQAYI